MGNYAGKQTVREETELDFSYQKLTALPLELTQETYDFLHLHTLNVSNNLLTSLLGIKRLIHLKHLNLEHNALKDLDEELYQLPGLETLNLSHNLISHIPEEIRLLKNLRELKCEYNKISSISSELYHLSNLTVLTLAHNQLDIFPLEISLLSHLKHLDLRANRIPSIPASALAQCTKLTVFNISHNALRELPPRLFDNTPNLQKLYVSHNQFRQLPNLDRLAALREVDVSFNKLDRAPQFKQKLAFFDVSSNPAIAGSSKPAPKEKEKEEAPINFAAEVEKGKRLFHITGHSYTRAIVYMVDYVSWRLPDMGFYMIDNLTSVYLWEAHRCSPATKEIAYATATAYAKELNIKKIEEFSADKPGDFWKQLDMQNPFAKARAPLPVRKDYYLEYVMTIKLFCIGEDTRGNIHVDLQAGKRPYHSQLSTDYCYVLDSGWDVFVWAGAASSSKQRQHALFKAEELMDLPRVKLSCIQWQFEGEETALFREQFLNWGISEIQVDIPVEPTTSTEKAMTNLKRRHDKLVKQPDADFGTFPEIKIVQTVKKPKIQISKAPERPPTPEKAKLIPTLPIKVAQQERERSLLGYAERPKAPKKTRAPSSNPVRDRQTRHMSHEKVSPRNPEKSPRGMFGDDWKKVQLKSTGVALYGTEEGNNGAVPFVPRLVQFQGKRSFIGRRLKPCAQSISLGSAYLLDTGKKGKLYIWADKTASRTSRGAALALAKALKDKERPAALVVNIEVGGDDTEFWKELGGKIDSPGEPVDEADGDTSSRDHISLHKVRNGADGFTLTTEASGSIKKEMLDPHSCYVLDADTEIYVWYGKQSTKADKDAAFKFAEEIEKEKQGWCAPISKEFETSEQVLFREKFIDWGGSIPISMQAVPVGLNVAPAKKQIKIDVSQLHKLRHVKEEPMVDDGTGKIKVWRVEDYTKVETPAADYGNFYVGDAYVILYTYIWKNVERYIIYFYQGRDATINDSGAAALLTVDLDDSLNRQAKEVRVVQGKEPKHFLTIFKGKLMLHQGQDPMGEGKKTEGPSLYDVRGNDPLNIKAIQVYPSTNMLNHCHVFIVLSDRTKKDSLSFVWCGNTSNEHERNFATNLLSAHGYTNVQQLNQGQETEDFWDVLGGQDFYYDKNADKRIAPRLFQCCEASGMITMEEVLNFYQDDLASEDVFLLDAYSEVYVWAGKLSTEGERKTAMQISLEYVTTATDGRPKQCPSHYLREGDETLQFAIHFQGFQWAPRHRMASMAMPNPADYPPVLKPLKLVTELLGEYNKTYTYKELLEKKYPKGLDGSKLETYLSDQEFQEIFTVTKPEFEAFPLWKKEAIKKELNLF